MSGWRSTEKSYDLSKLVLETVYVDVLGKRLVKVVPKGAFVPLFG